MNTEKPRKKLKGEIVEEIIKDKGIKLSWLAGELHISRATLYKKLRSNNLTDIFLFNLGRLINYDFDKVFPELKNSFFYKERKEDRVQTATNYDEQYQKELQAIQCKYARILEEYNKLLKFFIELMNDNEFYSIQKDIKSFVKQYIRENSDKIQ